MSAFYPLICFEKDSRTLPLSLSQRLILNSNLVSMKIKDKTMMALMINIINRELLLYEIKMTTYLIYIGLNREAGVNPCGVEYFH